MLSQSSASLNRCPGLTLKAWALIANGVLISSANVASLSVVTAQNLRVNFSVNVGANAVMDFVFSGLAGVMISGNTGAYMDVSSRDFTGAVANLPTPFFVAVYG